MTASHRVAALLAHAIAQRVADGLLPDHPRSPAIARRISPSLYRRSASPSMATVSRGTGRGNARAEVGDTGAGLRRRRIARCDETANCKAGARLEHCRATSTQTGRLRDVRTRRTMHEQGSLAQSVSTPPCHGRGRGFESRRNRSVPDGSTAEHPTVNRQVAGSNPARGARDSSLKEDPADVVAAPVLKTDCLKGRASSTLASSAHSAVRCWLRTRALNSDGAGSSPAGGALRTVKL